MSFELATVRVNPLQAMKLRHAQQQQGIPERMLLDRSGSGPDDHKAYGTENVPSQIASNCRFWKIAHSCQFSFLSLCSPCLSIYCPMSILSYRNLLSISLLLELGAVCFS